MTEPQLTPKEASFLLQCWMSGSWPYGQSTAECGYESIKQKLRAIADTRSWIHPLNPEGIREKHLLNDMRVLATKMNEIIERLNAPARL